MSATSEEEETPDLANHDPVVFYTSESVTYECPNGHTLVVDDGAHSKEDISWLRAFRGYCSSCEDEWTDFVAENEGQWAAILDENFPPDPTFFEWQAQRIADWKRLTTIPPTHYRDDFPADYPRKSDFSGMVPWIASEKS